ncbi:hypothetical protein [Sphingobium sp.]|uniref:hypothetical protein n=1 Tax=Sphingobium sp. TaxID=1912891 RepID=UPI0025811EA2|nr:hypothetical protein [Sphingobium sp.]
MRKLILLPVVIADRKVEFLFDTGFSESFIDTGIARDRGIQLTKSFTSLQTGLSVMPTALARTNINIGSKLNIEGQFMAADLGPLSRALGTPVAGVVGADALTPFVVVVNPQQCWIAIGFPGKVNINTSLKVDRKPENTQDVTALLPNFAPNSIPFGPDFVTKAKINGRLVNLAIDYGSNEAISLQETIWQQVIPPASRTGRTNEAIRADGLKSSGEVAAADLDLGQMSASNVPIQSETIHRRDGIDGSLGLAVLGATTTVLDMPKRRLVLFPPNLELSVSASPEPSPNEPKADTNAPIRETDAAARPD